MTSTLLLFCSVIVLLAITAVTDFVRSDAYRSAPWGLLWAASYSVYLAIPFGTRKIAGYTNIADVSPSLSQTVLERQATVLSLFAIGFTFGYLVYSLARKNIKVNQVIPRLSPKRSWSANRKEDNQHAIFNPDWTFTLTTGGVISAVAILATLTDFVDRYNTGAAEGIVPKILSTLAVNGYFSSCFLYIAGIKTAETIASKKQSVPAIRLNSRVHYFMLATEVAILFAYALKSGSRSIMTMCIVSIMSGYIMYMHISRRLAPARLIAIIGLMLALAFPLAETVRVARSSSSYYRFNPIHAAKLLGSSLTAKISPTEFAIRNRRDELSDSAYITISEYDTILITPQTPQANIRLSRSDLKELIEHRPLSLPEVSAQAINVISLFSATGSDALFHSKEQNAKRAIIIGLDPKSLSSGEQINLPADLYNKGGLSWVILGGCALGLILAGIREITTLTAERLFFEAGVYIKSIPLGLLAGNLSLPLLTQSWLVLVQLPKMICVSIVVGAVVRFAGTRLCQKIE